MEILFASFHQEFSNDVSYDHTYYLNHPRLLSGTKLKVRTYWGSPSYPRRFSNSNKVNILRYSFLFSNLNTLTSAIFVIPVKKIFLTRHVSTRFLIPTDPSWTYIFFHAFPSRSLSYLSGLTFLTRDLFRAWRYYSIRGIGIFILCYFLHFFFLQDISDQTILFFKKKRI